jgi:thioredoxin 1
LLADRRMALIGRSPPDPGEAARVLAEFLVVCLCAEWCGVCREYRSLFEAMAQRFPMASFHWLDIESDAEQLGDLEVDNFPTLILKRQQAILFYGAMEPCAAHLERTLGAFLQQSPAQSREYAFASAERREWQQNEDLLRLGPDHPGRVSVEAVAGTI